MLAIRRFWGQHKKKILITLGVFGSGYCIYKIYDGYQHRLIKVEQQVDANHSVDELIKAQLKARFENIQGISDSTTLPHAMQSLRSWMMEELDCADLIEKLGRLKGHPSLKEEKLKIWNDLKILSFTRISSALLAMTMLSLYVRVQVTILGRHLYLDFARSSDGLLIQDELGPLSKLGQQDFLGTSDYLPTHGIQALSMNMQHSAEKILKDIELSDKVSMEDLSGTILQILKLCMSAGAENSWMNYLLPENATLYAQIVTVSGNGVDDTPPPLDLPNLEKLISETRTVLSSLDFRNVVEISLKKVVDVVVEDMFSQLGAPPPAVPLAKLVPQVVQCSRPVLEDPSVNKFIHIIRSNPEVELYFTFLYASMPRET